VQFGVAGILLRAGLINRQIKMALDYGTHSYRSHRKLGECLIPNMLGTKFNAQYDVYTLYRWVNNLVAKSVYWYNQGNK
jgi:hypothetical protein